MPQNQKPLFLPREIVFLKLGEETNFTDMQLENNECDFCSGRLNGSGIYSTVKFFSKNFTEWDKLLDLGKTKNNICTKCSWFFSEKNLRTKNIYIKQIALHEYEVTLVEFNALSLILSKSLNNGDCLTVPMSGRKHLVPYLEWKHICIDDGNVFWGEREVEMFNNIVFLKSIGIPLSVISREKNLSNLSLSLLQKDNFASILTLWQSLDSWQKSLAFKLACHVAKGSSLINTQPILENSFMERNI